MIKVRRRIPISYVLWAKENPMTAHAANIEVKITIRKHWWVVVVELLLLSLTLGAVLSSGGGGGGCS